ncbi:MAG: hypothetical protein K0R34_186 [Herbinix sp.]|jgi:uncharacterized membrane protein YczE|nr:hypothetical protein [Herbinix sp.]
MKQINLFKITFALFGILLIGVGVAFNVANQLGNDPIGLIYDGMLQVLGLTEASLGTVSNILNATLIGILLIIGRRYINIGTIIYIIPYGLFINLGSLLYRTIAIETLSGRIIMSILGCAMIYLGVAIFIAVDIGLDPFTGIVMVLRDRFNMDFKKMKIIFDLSLILLGVLLGGTVGAITIVTALTAGPTIGWLANRMSTFIKDRYLKLEEFSV